MSFFNDYEKILACVASFDGVLPARKMLRELVKSQNKFPDLLLLNWNVDVKKTGKWINKRQTTLIIDFFWFVGSKKNSATRRSLLRCPSQTRCRLALLRLLARRHKPHHLRFHREHCWCHRTFMISLSNQLGSRSMLDRSNPTPSLYWALASFRKARRWTGLDAHV